MVTRPLMFQLYFCLLFCLWELMFSISFRKIRSLRNTIHQNLCFVLFAAELLFLLGIGKTEHKVCLLQTKLFIISAIVIIIIVDDEVVFH